MISEDDLIFDATHARRQTLTWNNTGQNITINLDMTGNNSATGDLGAGYTDRGTLTIRMGRDLVCQWVSGL